MRTSFVPGKRNFNLIPAAFSPMRADGAIHLEAIKPYADYLRGRGMTTVFVNGSTAESLSLTRDERRQLAESWMEAAAGRLKVMIHVGHNTIADAVALATHAEQIGAYAISAMAPTFFRPENVDDLVSFLHPIAQSAPATPFYYYHTPLRTLVELSMDEFLLKASVRIDNLAGLKYAHTDLAEFGLCQAKWSDRYDLLFGRDDLLLPALSLGAQGAIGTYYNLIPNTYQRLIQAFHEQDLTTARELSFLCGQFLRTVNGRGYLTYGKKLMKTLGVDCGDVRPPLNPGSQEVFEQLLVELKDLPMLDAFQESHFVPKMHLQTELRQESISRE